MRNPSQLRYTKDHEWVDELGDGSAVVGITHFAQNQLGDIVFVQLPEVGTAVSQSAKIGEVESVKSVSDIFTPVSGNVIETNTVVQSQPEQLNAEPYDAGWLVKILMSDPTELDLLLTSDEYHQLISIEEH